MYILYLYYIIFRLMYLSLLTREYLTQKSLRPSFPSYILSCRGSSHTSSNDAQGFHFKFH